MKRIIILISLIIAGSLISADTFAGKEEFIRKVNKEFSVNSDALLSVTNKYGDVTLENWTKNEVSIEVTITVEASTESKANKMFDEIDISISGSASKVVAETEIGNMSDWSGNKKFSIDYLIKMPASLNVDLYNKYGGIYVETIEGKADLTIKYGVMVAEKLPYNGNSIGVKYSKAEIDHLGDAEIDLKYSGMDIDHAGALDIDIKYSQLELEQARDLNIDSGYDEISIDEVENAVIFSKFSNVEIDHLARSLKTEVEYGGFVVDHVPAGFDIIKVVSRYANVELGIEEGATYTLEATVKYGSLDYSGKSGLNINKVSHTETKYEGTVGKGTAKSKIIASIKNGNLSIDD